MSLNKLALVLVSFVIIAASFGCSERLPAQVARVDSTLQGNQEVPANQTTEGNSIGVKATELICEVPFVVTDDNNFSIPAIINNTDRVTLMFHTANNGVVITREASKRATSVKFEKSADMNSWGGKSKGRISENNSLKIGSLGWDNLRIFQDRLSGPQTDGKFGPDLFKDNVIEIDFDSRALKIHSGLPTLSSDFKKLKLHQKNGMMFLTCSVKVGQKLLENKFLVHSGFGGGVLLDDAFAQANDIGKLRTLSKSELKDSGGNVLKTRKVELPALNIGGFELTNIPAQIFDGSIRKQKMSIIGGDVLKRFNMIFDRRDNSIYLQKNQLYETPFTK